MLFLFTSLFPFLLPYHFPFLSTFFLPSFLPLVLPSYISFHFFLYYFHCNYFLPSFLLSGLPFALVLFLHIFPCSADSLVPIGHVVVVDIVLWSLLAESDFHWQQPSWLNIVFLIRANNHTSKRMAHITLEHNSLMFQIIVMSPLVNFTGWLGQR